MSTLPVHAGSREVRDALPLRRRRLAAVVAVAGAVAGVTLALSTPSEALAILWTATIPLAPAVAVIALASWRAAQPSAAARRLSMAPRSTAGWRVAPRCRGVLQLVGLVLLVGVAPLHRLSIESPAASLALSVAGLTLAALVVGVILEWFDARPTLGRAERAAGTLAVGGVAGFVWGWLQVPDYELGPVYAQAVVAWGYPLVGALTSVGLFSAVRRCLPAHEAAVGRGFVAAALACYYGYRLPTLLGFSVWSGSDCLVDSRAILPAWFPLAALAVSALVAGWWLLENEASAQRRGRHAVAPHGGSALPIAGFSERCR